MKNKLNPGSEEAHSQGCICPILDNNKGEGAYLDLNGNPVFWYTQNCPIHSEAKDVDPETILFKKET